MVYKIILCWPILVSLKSAGVIKEVDDSQEMVQIFSKFKHLQSVCFRMRREQHACVALYPLRALIVSIFFVMSA